MKANQLAKKKVLIILLVIQLIIIILIGRVFYLQIINPHFLQKKAYEQQTRDRLIKPIRGDILDRNLQPIAVAETVASISVINAQIDDPENVAKILSTRLDLDYEKTLEKINKKVALMRIKTKTDKTLADEIRSLKLKGVVIDEDIKRVYPHKTLASQVIGFVGKDNQGIIGLEAKYDEILKGSQGKILTETDAKGKPMPNGNEFRIEPINGKTLVTTLDLNLQKYVEQSLDNALAVTKAKRGSIILMDPNNGEILAMANKPDFDLNQPFEIVDPQLKMIWNNLTSKEQNDSLNKMWRNFSINDTYEPGSTFKIFTSVAGLEEGLVTEDSTFTCSGHKIVSGIKIKCWRSPRNHGVQSFAEGVMNSCNPVFMDIAEMVDSEKFYSYLEKFGFKEKTGIDVSGEASSIFHKLENVGPVELATTSFGQSFQITPIQLLRAGSIIINGGYNITPHFKKEVLDENGSKISEDYNKSREKVISKETSDIMRTTLEKVVSLGTGNKTYLPGYKIGGKTATSEKLPRGNGKYIASFLAFAPANDPKVIALVLIDEPVGAYYGGQIAGPIMKEVMENTLPYLKVTPKFTEEEQMLEEVIDISVPNFINMETKEAVKLIKELGLEVIKNTSTNEGVVINQFPMENEIINKGSKIILFVQ